jgi:ankyrin repeat protein
MCSVSPQICAAEQGAVLLAQSRSVQLVKEQPTQNPRNPNLMTAVMNSDESDVANFIVLGADLNQRVDGTTYLIAAVTNNDLEMVKFLVGKGADVNKMDGRGLTPMVYAKSLRFIKPEIIRYLESAGATDPFATRR